MTQHCTITGTMLVLVHYIVCTLKKKISEITVFVVVKINSFRCQCQLCNNTVISIVRVINHGYTTISKTTNQREIK